MTVRTAAGTKLYIGPVATSATDTAAEYAALAWTEVGEVESLGDFGDQAATTNFTALGDRRVRKIKTTFDAGTLAVVLGRDPSDDGQAAMIAALAEDDDYAFKVELNDQPQGSPSNPTIFYFRGQVLGYNAKVGAADNVIRADANIAINSAIVEVPAASA